jgi:hypothetical protein
MSATATKLLTGLGLLLTLGCADSIVREVDETNNPAVTSTPERFEFIATEMRNVSDKLVFVWPNPATKATVHHDSFLHHGYGVLVIQDAVGAVVDSTLLEWELDTETKVGTPGDWTVTLTLASARGRAEFSLIPIP